MSVLSLHAERILRLAERARRLGLAEARSQALADGGSDADADSYAEAWLSASLRLPPGHPAAYADDTGVWELTRMLGVHVPGAAYMPRLRDEIRGEPSASPPQLFYRLGYRRR